MAIKIESIQKGFYKAKIGDVILDNRTTERKAKDDGINYCLEHNLDSYTILFPDFVAVSLDGVEDEPPTDEPPVDEEEPVDEEPPTEPSPEDEELTFPDNAYFLKADANGNFTKAMVETAALNNDYIVFDADTLDIHYEESPHFKKGWLTYIVLNDIKGTEEKPITLDFRKVYINCFPSIEKYDQNHRVIDFINCENIILKLGKVDGDKFKRDLNNLEESKLENTYFVRSNAGSQNIVTEDGDVSGFMADMASSSVLGTKSIYFTENKKVYFLQPDGRYESKFFNIDNETYKYFGLTGGLGYYRLLKYDMDDVIFKFYDENENFVTEITNAKYFGTYEIPDGVKKVKVNVNAMDGRTENPTFFGHRFEYNPNKGTVIRNMKIRDNHRGGISNIGAGSIIENNQFFSTQRYLDSPKFPDTTTYHINCEDAVSRDLIIRNNTFADKFHKILLTHNINVDIVDNTFTGSGFNIFIYDVIYGNVERNNFESKGIVNLGTGTNINQVVVSDNIGSPEVQLTNASEWYNNNFSDGILKGRGKAHNNTFTNYNVDRLNWTKEIQDNEFIGINGVSITYPSTYIYKNKFKDAHFRFSDGDNKDELIVFDSVEIDNTNTPNVDGFKRTYGDAKIVAVNSTFKSFKINNTRTNEAIDFEDGNWYFENCIFENIENYLIKLGSNHPNNIPEKFYFKNCTFQGSGLFASNTVWNLGMTYEIVFDNCTIDSNLTMPSSYTFGEVTMPTLVEPRTQPIPKITTGEARFPDCTIIRVDFHYFTLKIRNKNTGDIVLDKTVASGYLHYNTTPNDFEYSIDSGKYWDAVLT